MAQLVKNPPAMQETWVRSLGGEDPLEQGQGKAILSSFWPGEFHGLYIPWGHKEWDRLSDFHFTSYHSLNLHFNATGLEFNNRKILPDHSHNIHSKNTRISQEVFRKEKLSSSRIHFCDIIPSTVFKLSCLLCNHQFQA